MNSKDLQPVEKNFGVCVCVCVVLSLKPAMHLLCFPTIKRLFTWLRCVSEASDS